jgi:hypothetical protein
MIGSLFRRRVSLRLLTIRSVENDSRRSEGFAYCIFFWVRLLSGSLGSRTRRRRTLFTRLHLRFCVLLAHRLCYRAQNRFLYRCAQERRRRDRGGESSYNLMGMLKQIGAMPGEERRKVV